MGTIKLTEQQMDALQKTKKWWIQRNKQVWEISGIAGSGKTTIVKCLIEELGLKRDEVLYVAYVGKATLALSRKGNTAQTIHSTIYDIIMEPRKDENGNVAMYNGKPSYYPIFVRKEALAPNIGLIV